MDAFMTGPASGASPPPSDNLFVSNLPEGMDDGMLKAVFGQYGTVIQCKVMPNAKGGHGSGLVRFSSLEEATWICENLPGTIPQGLAEVVQVRYANSPQGEGETGGGFSGLGGLGSLGLGGGGGGGNRSSPYGGGGGKGGPRVKDTLCRFFEQGGCTRGASCFYAHGAEEIGTAVGGGGGAGGFAKELSGGLFGASNGVLSGWVKPAGGGSDERRAMKETACYFFKQGKCVKGEECKFSHDPSILAQDESNGWEVAPGFSRAPGMGKGGPGPTAAAMLGAATPLKGGGGFGRELAVKGGDFGKGGGGGGFGKGGKDFGKGGDSKAATVSIGMVVQGLFKSGCLPGGESYSNDENTLCVKGLPFDTDDFALYQIFSPFGAIAPRGIRAMLNPDGTCRGIGFVNFLDVAASTAAIATLNGCQLPDNSVLSVEVKSDRPQGRVSASRAFDFLEDGRGGSKGVGKASGGSAEEQTMAQLEAALAAGDLDTLTALGLGDAFGLPQS